MSPEGVTLGRANREFPQHFPQPGWVEHEPEEIWESVVAAVGEALNAAGVSGSEVAAIGITNQRETTLLWERDTGRPVHRAIVWQDRRTAGICQELSEAGIGPRLREITGLVIDPYFSGTKIRWLLDHVPDARAGAERGEILFGTVDSYLVWRLTGGARGGAPHVTDVTNASRTLLMDLESRRWSPEMAELLRIPAAMLPRIVASAEVVERTRGLSVLPDGIPISGIAGDQHAALFGQGCLEVGDSKCTYGTGAFLLVNVGRQPVRSRSGMLSTLAWQIGNEAQYAIEGSVFVAGAAIQWLRDGLRLFGAASESESLARSVPSSDGVVFVPALSGLGAPYWDADARGLITGLTRGSTAAHLTRATLEAIAFQVTDLVSAMSSDLGRPLTRIRVDGGAAANNLLMELQADFAQLSVERPDDLETTARGAAMLAGVGAGLFQTAREASKMFKIERTFEVKMKDLERNQRLSAWHNAVRRARSSS